jgi:DNA-binding LytR/AlgR family response regulator
VTTGADNGTSGWPRVQWGPWLAIALVGVVVAAVNATSNILEFERAGVDVDWWEPVVWEVSSAVIIVAMAPLVGWAVRRWPPKPDGFIRFGLIHFGLTIPFSLAHIAAILVLRNAVYWLARARYGFFDDGVGIVLLYEWRKDVLVYALLAAVYWVWDFLAARRAPTTAPDGRIEVRDGGTAVFLAPADILFVEAAGNYIEFHTAARTHLVRGTLSAWETRLSERGFARVHRSRLVNRTHIRALKPTPSGDVEITLDDGHTILGSRRYRSVLGNDEERTAGA